MITRRALVLCLLLLAWDPALAAPKSFHVTGQVFSASPVLASYGVVNGATVEVDWTVELTTPPISVQGPPDNKTDYYDAVTFMVIQSGTWLAVLTAPLPGGHHFVSVADDSGGTLDLLHLTVNGTDNDQVLRQNAFLNLSLDFYDIRGAASSNQSLDQDPSQYPIGVGSAIGPGGAVHFEINGSGSGGGGGPTDPTASCRKAQLKAAAKLCRSELVCHAKYAKSPASDPLGDMRDLCLEKADAKFALAYDAAAAKALARGLECGTTAPASEPLADISAQVDDIVAGVSAIEPSHPPLEYSWLNAAGAACAASVGAQSAHAGKADVDKLVAKLTKASGKLDAAADKAAAAAADQGVVFDPALDISAFHDSVDAAIDLTTSSINGE